jgi:hypothetical protein
MTKVVEFFITERFRFHQLSDLKHFVPCMSFSVITGLTVVMARKVRFADLSHAPPNIGCTEPPRHSTAFHTIR